MLFLGYDICIDQNPERFTKPVMFANLVKANASQPISLKLSKIFDSNGSVYVILIIFTTG